MQTDQVQQIRQYVHDGWGGRALAFYRTSQIDLMIADVLRKISDTPDFAVLATGSYGRQELCPFSDIDIMVFSKRRDSAETARAFFYALWDTGYDVSHAFRTPAECVAESLKDNKTRTSMLEARYICGDASLVKIYREDVLQKIRARKKNEYITGMMKAVRERHLKQGMSPFLLQPDIKESKGGLRDIHNALWLSSIIYRFEDIKDFIRFLTKDELKKLSRAYDFLLRLRFIVHLLSGRKNDRFLFEYHEESAKILGIRRSKKFSAVERMMRYYFLQVRNISTFSDEILRKCGEEVTRKFFRFGTRKINDDFSLSNKQLMINNDDILKDDPTKIFEAFHLSAARGYQMSARLLNSIRRSSINLRPKHRSDRMLIGLFFNILNSGRAYLTLRNMHETGILDRFIPEFGALRHRMISDYYHTYPVDEHSLMCIQRLEELSRTKNPESEGLPRLFRDLERKDILYLALLLHDSGKAKGKVHEAEGYKIIIRISDRFHLDVKSREMIEFLVRNHMIMAETAFKHDVESPEVVAAFAHKVMTEEYLNALYVMTYADMSSVSGSFWTRWRSSLLDGLFLKAKAHLLGFRIQKERILRNIRIKYGREVDVFLAEMPEDYFISVPVEKIPLEGALFMQALKEGFAMRVDSLEDGTVSVIVTAQDRAGMFADIVSVFAVRRLNIIDAKLITAKNGWAFDKIRISNWSELWWEGMNEMVEQELRNVIIDRKKIVITDHGTRGRGIEPFIEIDNEKNEICTVVEIMAQDRIGLLYEIAQAFGNCAVNIMSGRINTEQGVANDVFYVNKDGKKLDSEAVNCMMNILWKTVKN